MKIIIDAMGGDNAPGEIVRGALLGAKETGAELVLVGQETAIRAVLKLEGIEELPANVTIVHAEQIVDMEDDPSTVLRQKKDSSMAVALRLLHDGGGDAVISAGSTGALLSGATLLVKRIRGIRRAAMAPVLPSKNENGVLLIDCGANAECTPEYLLQFAYMGSFYAKSVMGVETPRVGLLNIGAEETKGTALQKESYVLLKQAGEAGRICFTGNCEARDVLMGGVDVVVADGYSGNILLKGIEGVGMFMLSKLKGVFMKNLRTKLAAAAVKGDMRAFKNRLDPSRVGGTMLLGITRPVLKAHGSSNAKAICSAVHQAVQCVQGDVCGLIAANVSAMKVDSTTEE